MESKGTGRTAGHIKQSSAAEAAREPANRSEQVPIPHVTSFLSLAHRREGSESSKRSVTSRTSRHRKITSTTKAESHCKSLERIVASPRSFGGREDTNNNSSSNNINTDGNDSHVVGGGGESVVPPQPPAQAEKVLDFFRQVTHDARKVKTKGTSRLRRYRNSIANVTVRALKRIRAPDPGYDRDLDGATDDELEGGDDRYERRGSLSDGAESLLHGESEDDELEDDIEEKAKEQKGKVRELGELPALDWSNVATSLTICVVLIGGLLILSHLVATPKCFPVGGFCLEHWGYAACWAVGTYFIIELMTKCLTRFFSWSRLLHTNNKVWIFVKLNKSISNLLWSAWLFGSWYWFRSRVDDHGYNFRTVEALLGCGLAYCVFTLIQGVVQVEMARRYMWTPYLERARASIWSQYIIFMLTDFAMGVQIDDKDGQRMALQFARSKRVKENLVTHTMVLRLLRFRLREKQMSLYVVGKAIGFVHVNALKHPLGSGMPGTDEDGMIISKNGARLFGGLLFDALILANDTERRAAQADAAAPSRTGTEDPRDAATEREGGERGGACALEEGDGDEKKRVGRGVGKPAKEGALQPQTVLNTPHSGNAQEDYTTPAPTPPPPPTPLVRQPVMISSPPPAGKPTGISNNASQAVPTWSSSTKGRVPTMVGDPIDTGDSKETGDAKAFSRLSLTAEDERRQIHARSSTIANFLDNASVGSARHSAAPSANVHNISHEQLPPAEGVAGEVPPGNADSGEACPIDTPAPAPDVVAHATKQYPVDLDDLIINAVVADGDETPRVLGPPTIPKRSSIYSLHIPTGQHPLRRPSLFEIVAAGAAPGTGVGGGGSARARVGAGGIGGDTPRHGETGSPLPPGITMETLRSVTSRTISLKIMELFDQPEDGRITRKAFAEHMMGIFVQRRSLQLTLGDYKAILVKVGLVMSTMRYMVLFFVWLKIVGYDIASVFITWISLAVALSFLFGSSASAFFESIVFVFVTKAYDVGDCVYFADDCQQYYCYVVSRINILTTVFLKWDGQCTLMPNNIMAKKTIRNQWRSGPHLHHTMLIMPRDTSAEKLDEMKAGLMQRFSRGKRAGEGGWMTETVNYGYRKVLEGDKVAMWWECRQRYNGSDMGLLWRNFNVFIKEINRQAMLAGIPCTMPVQPVSWAGGPPSTTNDEMPPMGIANAWEHAVGDSRK